MAAHTFSTASSEPQETVRRCPIDHTALSVQKTGRVGERTEKSIERDPAGVWHVRGYEQARTILRTSETKQAGFKVELLERMPQRMTPPILFQDGKAHHEQRKQTARFFTPKAVKENYQQLMEDFARRLVSKLQRDKRADLSAISMQLAVRVAGEVVGLTNSRLPGMHRRLNAFFTGNLDSPNLSPRTLFNFARSQVQIAAFFYLDVKPSIEARRRQPREDVISHLLERGYGDAEILTECITYGAAGMATTREFISIATWHLLEQPVLRQQYGAGSPDERQQILQEMLRLEPVVGHLYRRSTADLQVDDGDTSITIPAGSLIDLHIYAINADIRVVGDYPLLICPDREPQADRVGPAMMSFGDGHHRCPGAYIALQETDIFLQRLLQLDGLEIAQKPSVTWNDLTQGYELRDFILVVR